MKFNSFDYLFILNKNIIRIFLQHKIFLKYFCKKFIIEKTNFFALFTILELSLIYGYQANTQRISSNSGCLHSNGFQSDKPSGESEVFNPEENRKGHRRIFTEEQENRIRNNRPDSSRPDKPVLSDDAYRDRNGGKVQLLHHPDFQFRGR